MSPGPTRSHPGTSTAPNNDADRESSARVLWIALYVVLLLAPLALMFAAGDVFRRSWIVDFSVALGFIGLVMLALQAVMPSRARAFTAPFGIDVLLGLHRQLGFVALVLVIAHVALLLINDPSLLYLLDPTQAPWRARFGALAVLAFVALAGTSVWRSRARLSYEGWRGLHVLLAIAVLAFSLLHIVGVGHYVTFSSLRWAALAAVLGGLLAVPYLRVMRQRSATKRPYRVARVVAERGEATTIELEAEHDRARPFRPGQFAWLKLAGAPYALAEHPFSYASSAERASTVQFTVKAIGDFTTKIRELRPGTTVLIDGPHGSFRLPETAPLVLIAAGVGITPTMSVLRTLADRSDARRLRLIYASRDYESITFREELAELESQLSLEVVHVLSRADERWRGQRGRLNRLMLARLLPDWVAESEVFICGPTALTRTAVRDLLVLGVEPDRVHAERFISV